MENLNLNHYNFNFQVNFHAFYSHRVEFLYEELKRQMFFLKQNPFARRIVIVPSPAMKTWLHLRLAKDIGIAAGLEIGYIDESFRKIISFVESKPIEEPSQLELSLLIEHRLATALRGSDPLWDSVRKFIGVFENPSKGFKRLASLSMELSRLFMKYGVYGGEEVLEWGVGFKDCWQKKLWRDVWHSAPQFSYPYKGLKDFVINDMNLLLGSHAEVHVFSMSFMPRIYHRMLECLSNKIPVHYYVLSPCQVFWSDIRSDRECHRLYAHWKQKGISQGQLTDLDDFLRDRNPILANFGRLGREMALQLENSHCQTGDLFAVHSQISEQSSYNDLINPDIALEVACHEPTVLEYLQTDLTLLRTPSESEKIELSPADRTIQVHICPNKQREIEIIYNTIMGRMDAHREDEAPLDPSDFIVMAPDLTAYEPYIKMVFGSPDSRLDFQLMEIQLFSQSPFVKAFLQLIRLSESRWDAASLIEIFEQPYVQRKHNFTYEDARKFREWIQQAGIRWGEDSCHRDEILKRENCRLSLVKTNDNESGTWERGVERLLVGLASTKALGNKIERFSPLELIDGTGGELLGRWIEFLKSIKSDLKISQDGTCLTMDQWSEFMKAMIESYLSVDISNKEENQHREELMAHIEALGKVSSLVKGYTVPFQTAFSYLEMLLNSQRINYRETHLKAVRFCSLLPMRAIPAKAVILIGMEDQVFPRKDIGNGLDLLADNLKSDYSPYQNDFDRSLFLEAIMSARQYFIISYTGYCEGKTASPSVLLSELLSYLDSNFKFAEGRFLDFCLYHHPLNRFDRFYFREDSEFKSYHLQAFRLAQAFYAKEKINKHLFLPDFKVRQSTLISKKATQNHQIFLSLQDLGKMAKNPLQVYFNQAFGMFVREGSNREVEVEENFILDNLEMHRCKSDSLRMDAAEIVRERSKEGSLPAGLFKDVFVGKFEEEAREWDSNLAKMKIKKSDIFKITLASHCEYVAQDNQNWICPPLNFTTTKGSNFVITGVFEYVSKEGLIVLKKNKLEEIIEVWPLYLMFNMLAARDNLPIKIQLLLLKDGNILELSVPDLSQALNDFLEYYLFAIECVSPLLPQWMPHILSGDEDKLFKTIQGNFERNEDYFFNEYAKWSFEGSGTSLNANEIISEWHKTALQVFGPLATIFGNKGK